MATTFIAAGTTTLPSIAAADVINFPEGAQVVSSGLNNSAIGFVSKVNASRRFIGHVGAYSGPWMLGVSGSINWNAGGGSLFLQPSSISGNTLVNLTNSGFATVAVLGGGAVTNLYAESGTTSIAEGTDLTNLYVSGGNVAVEYDSTGITIFNQTSGKSTIRRPSSGANTWRIMGGECTIERRSTDGSPGITLTTTTIEIGNATVRLATASTIASVKLLHPNAKLDWSRIPAACTISSLEGDVSAITATGLRAGTQTTEFGINLTVTAIAQYGKPLGLASVQGGWQ